MGKTEIERIKDAIGNCLEEAQMAEDDIGLKLKKIFGVCPTDINQLLTVLDIQLNHIRDIVSGIDIKSEQSQKRLEVLKNIAKEAYDNFEEYFKDKDVPIEEQGMVRLIEDRLMVLADLKTKQGERLFDESGEIYLEQAEEPAHLRVQEFPE